MSNETRYVSSIWGDDELLRTYAVDLNSLMTTDDDDFFDREEVEVIAARLPVALARFAGVQIRHVVFEDDELTLLFARGERYNVEPLAHLARSHPHLAINVSASREYEWEVYFRASFRNGRQAEPWAMIRNPIIAGQNSPGVELLTPDHRVGAFVHFRCELQGEGRGRIVAIEPNGDIEIERIGPLDSATEAALKACGRPIDEPHLLGQTSSGRIR